MRSRPWITAAVVLALCGAPPARAAAAPRSPMSEVAAQAERAFDAERWAEAAVALHRVASGETGDHAGQRELAEYHLGIALHRLGFHQASLDVFRRIAQDRSHPGFDKAPLWLARLSAQIPDSGRHRGRRGRVLAGGARPLRQRMAARRGVPAAHAVGARALPRTRLGRGRRRLRGGLLREPRLRAGADLSGRRARRAGPSRSRRPRVPARPRGARQWRGTGRGARAGAFVAREAVPGGRRATRRRRPRPRRPEAPRRRGAQPGGGGHAQRALARRRSSSWRGRSSSPAIPGARSARPTRSSVHSPPSRSTRRPPSSARASTTRSATTRTRARWPRASSPCTSRSRGT